MTYGVREFAERYKVGQHTVLAWIASGELAAINVSRTPGGKPRWRITQEAAQAFEILRSAQPAPDPAPRRRRKRSDDLVKFY
jgi:hypothetical protein